MSDTFDFDAFIDGTEMAQAKTGFFRKDHRVKIVELTKAHDALPVTAGDTREGSKSSPRKKIADEIASLREEMEASRVDITIRALTPDEYKAISEEEDGVYDQLATQSVEPKLTAEQWRKLAAAIGYAQFSVITNDAATLILSKVAVPDFSRTVSETLSPPTSSES